VTDEEDPVYAKFEAIRDEALIKLPLWRHVALRTVWRRHGCTICWNLTPLGEKSREWPPFYVVVCADWFVYAISRDVAVAMPDDVHLAMHGCMLVHISRFWHRSGEPFRTCNAVDLQRSPVWARSMQIAAAYHFPVERMRRWLESPENPRNIVS
jgi:hypothetical protein